MIDRILTKKDIAKARLRWFYSLESPNTFERLQAVSFAYTVSDSLQKIYKDDQEGLKDAMKRHLEFFNTEGTVGSLIVGIVLALEEKKKIRRQRRSRNDCQLKIRFDGSSCRYWRFLDSRNY